jgi:hypothetical protein
VGDNRKRTKRKEKKKGNVIDTGGLETRIDRWVDMEVFVSFDKRRKKSGN